MACSTRGSGAALCRLLSEISGVSSSRPLDGQGQCQRSACRKSVNFRELSLSRSLVFVSRAGSKLIALVTDYPLGARRTAAPQLNADPTTVEWPARRGCAKHHRSRPGGVTDVPSSLAAMGSRASDVWF